MEYPSEGVPTGNDGRDLTAEFIEGADNKNPSQRPGRNILVREILLVIDTIPPANALEQPERLRADSLLTVRGWHPM